jgi:hypothetical protein
MEAALLHACDRSKRSYPTKKLRAESRTESKAESRAESSSQHLYKIYRPAPILIDKLSTKPRTQRTMACPHCFRGGKAVGDPKGSITTIHGVQTYVADIPSTTTSSSRIIYYTMRSAFHSPTTSSLPMPTRLLQAFEFWFLEYLATHLARHDANN